MKKYLILIAAFLMLIGLVGCDEGGDITLNSTPQSPDITNTSSGETEWAIYWYLCGSDLESEYGSATDDLIEMMEVELPENVKVVIQTGGAHYWYNEVVDADMGQRFVYDSDGLTLIEEFEPVNMGDPDTLADFLAFATENYPANNTMVNFWNHGGGSVSGVAFDEQFDMDALTLDELYASFTSVYTEDPDDQPVDIIGFDTCLMATIDTAYIFSDLGKYLVASEELEPGNGWYYSGIMEALALDPQISPLDLSIEICDTYVEGCELEWTEDDITLSVINLSKLEPLIVAYEDFGREALESAIADPSFFTHFSKVAHSIENYGGNTREQGFTNMADLGHLAAESYDLLPETSGAVIDAIENCVEYKVAGKYRPESMGISCYYSYNGDIDDLEQYMYLGVGESFKHFYAYGLTGDLPSDGYEYVEELDVEYDTLPELYTLDSVSWEDYPLYVDDEALATLDLGPEAWDILSSIAFELYYIDIEEDILISLGIDNDIIADWDNGVFKDNFRGVWGSIDGYLVYMELVYEGDDYNEYAVPILLNGEDYNLSVIYDFVYEEYYIEGARRPIDEYGAADKNLRYLEVGDEIQTIHYATFLSDDSDFMSVPIDTIIVTEDIAFYETDLGDGMFMMMYIMTDMQYNTAYSDIATFEIIDGEIYTSVD